MLRNSMSFCSACMGRRRYYEQTLPENLDTLRKLDGQVELVLVDYNSNDGLREWVLDEFAGDLDSGLLKYFRTEEPERYVHSHAKNLSHRLASHELLCNLDGDNFIGVSCQVMDDLFTRAPRTVARLGPSGRVSLPRNIFLDELGGYDERFQVWGLEEDDLLARARAANISVRRMEPTGGVLDHTQDERFENLAVPGNVPSTDGLSPELLRFATKIAQDDPRKMRSFLTNAHLYMDNRRARRIRAGAPGEFGNATVVDHTGRATKL